MGVLDRVASLLAYSNPPRVAKRFASPWGSSSVNGLQAITSELFGGEYAPVTRAEAMRVPAVAKARALIVGTLARQPLRVFENGEPVEDMPHWLQGTNVNVPLWHRMGWTIDDLFFHGCSLWATTRNGGTLEHAMRIPFDAWEIDEFGQILVKDPATGKMFPVPADQVILFQGPQEGLLEVGADTIRGARAIERTIKDRAETPHASITVEVTDGIERDEDEIDELLEGFIASRRKIAGQSIGYQPAGINLRYDGGEPAFLIEARNAYRLDIAAFANLPAALLDASLSTASLTYSTKEGSRNELLDYSLGYWADPIASRLSLDDVVEPGKYVRFEMTEFTALVQSGTGPVTED